MSAMEYGSAYGNNSYFDTPRYQSGNSQPMARHDSGSSDGTVVSLSPTASAPFQNLYWRPDDDEYATTSAGNSPNYPLEYADESLVTYPSSLGWTQEYYPEGYQYQEDAHAAGEYVEKAEDIASVPQPVVKSEPGQSRPREKTRRESASSGHWLCFSPNCSRSFDRKADLERHMTHKHKPRDPKMARQCDYPPCSRNTEPFYREDHYRDHYRDYHQEDLMRKIRNKDAFDEDSWFKSRKVSKMWWRCSKCLKRNSTTGEDPWHCHATDGCSGRCETRRRQLRGFDTSSSHR